MSAACRVCKVSPNVPDEFLPVRKRHGDSGFDLFCYFPMGYYLLAPGERSLVPTGVCVQVMHGYGGQVLGRSSSGLKGLLVFTGELDSNYRGELMVCVQNIGSEDYCIDHGDRIAQLVVRPIHPGPMVVVDSLPTSNRNGAGFGSTGR